MRLIRLELENYRCFERAEFEFSDITLLVGGNGSGKTAALQAMVGLLTTLHGRYGGESPTPADRTRWVGESLIQLEWCSLDPAPLKAALRVHDKGIGWAPMGRETKIWKDALRSLADQSRGVICSFDAFRLLPPLKVDGPNVSAVPQTVYQHALTPTLGRGGQINARFAQLKQWLVNIDYARVKAKADRGEEFPVWDLVREGLERLLSPYRFVGVNQRFEVIFETPSGTVPLAALSDGFRSVFVIVAELLMRLWLTGAPAAEMLDVEAVCRIDEIDAHLHPRWQEGVLPGLRTMFPAVQFIATTHSPRVVVSVAPHQVYRLGEL